MKFPEKNSPKWHESPARLIKFEKLFEVSSTTFNVAAFVGIFYLLFSLQSKSFQGLAPLEVYLINFLAIVLGLNCLQALFLLYLRYRRQDVEQMQRQDGKRYVYSRSQFTDVLRKELRRAGRYHFPMTLCVMELDELEEYAKKTGGRDQALEKFAALMIGIIRASDHLGFYEKHKLVVLLCHTNLVNAESFLYRSLLQSQERLEMSFSAGLTSFRIGENEQGLFKRADSALTNAKQRGRKKIHCAIGKHDEKVIKSF